MLPPSLRVRDYARKTLKPRHKLVVARMAEALFTADDPLQEGRLLAFADEVDRAISNASKTLRFGLVVMLDALRLLPLFLVGRPGLFDDLSLADRQRMLDKMERSSFIPLILIFVAYKTMMTMIWFEEPAELRAIGYTGPERDRYKRGLVEVPSVPPPPWIAAP